MITDTTVTTAPATQRAADIETFGIRVAVALANENGPRVQAWERQAIIRGRVYQAADDQPERDDTEETTFTICEGGCDRALSADEAVHARCGSLLVRCSDCLADHASGCLVCGAE